MIVLAVFVSSIHGYNKSMEASVELFDAKLADVAQILAQMSPAENNSILIKQGSTSSKFNTSLTFQVWNNARQLVAASRLFDDINQPEFKNHIGNENFSSTRWRTLMHYYPEYNKWVWVAEKQNTRFQLAENIILESIIPSLMVIPFIGIVILLIVRRGLTPIKELAFQIASKKANELGIIQMEETPSELHTLTESVNQLLTRLESSFEREKRLASDTAHELRTPIAALQLQVDNLVAESKDSKNLATLITTSRRLKHLTEQILTLNKTTPDLFANKMLPLDITPIIRMVIANHYSLLQEKQQSIEMDAVSCFIATDTFAIETLFSNLLVNAIKYTPEQGKIKVKLYYQNNQVIMELHDNGPGIPSTKYGRVLERFYRLDGDRNNSQIIGCGLGLTIVNHIVQLHHAELLFFQSDFKSGLGVKVSFQQADPGGSSQ